MNSKIKKEIKKAIAVIDDNKGEDVIVLDLMGKSSFTDYIILVSVMSDPHAKALKISLDKEFKDSKIKIFGSKDTLSSGWLIMDAFDFVIHIQTKIIRDLYRLEEVYEDATEIDLLKI